MRLSTRHRPGTVWAPRALVACRIPAAPQLPLAHVKEAPKWAHGALLNEFMSFLGFPPAGLFGRKQKIKNICLTSQVRCADMPAARQKIHFFIFLGQQIKMPKMCPPIFGIFWIFLFFCSFGHFGSFWSFWVGSFFVKNIKK